MKDISLKTSKLKQEKIEVINIKDDEVVNIEDDEANTMDAYNMEIQENKNVSYNVIFYFLKLKIIKKLKKNFF